MKGSTARRRRDGEPADRKGRGSKKTEGGEGPLEWLRSFAVAILLFLVIRTFLVQAYTIPSSSMEDTLLVGDYLMANNAIFGAHVPFTSMRLPAFREPAFGDIVVFRPSYNQPVIDVVKRVIGEPGDTVEMRDRVIIRNGAVLDEPYVEPNYLPDQPLQRFGPGGYDWHLQALPENVEREGYTATRDSWGPLIVPANEFLLLGDNRDQSLDSRYMGFVTREEVRGKAIFIYFSYDRTADAPFPRFLTAARWNRIGNVIR